MNEELQRAGGRTQRSSRSSIRSTCVTIAQTSFRRPGELCGATTASASAAMQATTLLNHIPLEECSTPFRSPQQQPAHCREPPPAGAPPGIPASTVSAKSQMPQAACLRVRQGLPPATSMQQGSHVTIAISYRTRHHPAFSHPFDCAPLRSPQQQPGHCREAPPAGAPPGQSQSRQSWHARPQLLTAAAQPYSAVSSWPEPAHGYDGCTVD